MGCSLIKKKKQKLQLESQDVAQQQNELLIRSTPLNLQSSQENNLKLNQSHLLNNQNSQIRTTEKLLLIQGNRQNREMRKNKYTSQRIIGLLEDQRECYRMKDDQLRSSGNQSTYGSPIKKFLYKSDRSIKVRPIKNLVNIF